MRHIADPRIRSAARPFLEAGGGGGAFMTNLSCGVGGLYRAASRSSPPSAFPLVVTLLLSRAGCGSGLAELVGSGGLVCAGWACWAPCPTCTMHTSRSDRIGSPLDHARYGAIPRQSGDLAMHPARPAGWVPRGLATAGARFPPGSEGLASAPGAARGLAAAAAGSEAPRM
jgi:hypothetical protein